MAISSDLWSEATEEEGIAIASKDEEGIEHCYTVKKNFIGSGEAVFPETAQYAPTSDGR